MWWGFHLGKCFKHILINQNLRVGTMKETLTTDFLRIDSNDFDQISYPLRIQTKRIGQYLINAGSWLIGEKLKKIYV